MITQEKIAAVMEKVKAWNIQVAPVAATMQQLANEREAIIRDGIEAGIGGNAMRDMMPRPKWLPRAGEQIAAAPNDELDIPDNLKRPQP